MRDLFLDTLPLWPVDEEGRCGCGQPDCRRPGKHPARNATGPGYAVITGAEGGVFVVDVDVKGGVDGYGQLAELDALPETLTVRTGSGGAHFYFKHPGFRVGCGKLASAIDIKGDKDRDRGLVYVVGPGSPGYVQTEDPCVARAGDPYEVVLDVPIAPAPEWLLSWLRIGETRGEGFAPDPIDESHPDWAYRVQLGIDACKTLPPSRADGEAGKRLFAICLRLVRGLELPLEKAFELLIDHFNPRCTQSDGVTPFPWDDDDLVHKLEDVRDRSEVACGILSQATLEGYKAIGARLGNRNRTPIAPPPAPAKDKVDAARAYDGERVKITRAGLTQMLFNWPDWDGVLWFDVLSQKPRATNPPIAGRLTLENGELSKGDFALIAHWLDVKGFLASKEMIEDALWTVVRSPDRQRNLIVEYFDSLEPVTEAKVLPTLATDVFGCTDPFANTLLMKTLVAAVRRARCPGHFHKGMLVMKGEQGCGKTPAVKILAGPFYHSTGNGNLADRDTILECQGKSLVEVEELSAMGKADENALKTAISRTADVITKKYEPDGRTYPRSFVLIGTTNKDEFLTDSTGNARYHVIEVGQIDLARLEELRDRIWAEAEFLARSGLSNELENAERATLDEKNKVYLNTHPWLDDVAKFLAGKKEVASASEVLMHIVKNEPTKASKTSKNDVADLMRVLGCESKPVWRNGKTVKVWRVPEDLHARASSRVQHLRAVMKPKS
jgi:predicted P-loop ATPase